MGHVDADGGGDASASSPDSAADDVHDAETVSPEDAARALARWRAEAARMDDLERAALASPAGLDWLDALPDTHPLRVGLRCKVWHVDDAGRHAIVRRDWAHALPTEERLAELVSQGLPPGEYVVRLARGREALPYVRIRVAAPVQRSPEGDPLALVERVARLLSPHGLLQAPEPEAAALREDVQSLRDDVDGLQASLAAATERLAAAVRRARSADEDGSGFDLGELLRLAPHVLGAIAPARSTPAPAPEANGREGYAP